MNADGEVAIRFDNRRYRVPFTLTRLDEYSFNIRLHPKDYNDLRDLYMGVRFFQAKPLGVTFYSRCDLQRRYLFIYPQGVGFSIYDLLKKSIKFNVSVSLGNHCFHLKEFTIEIIPYEPLKNKLKWRKLKPCLED